MSDKGLFILLTQTRDYKLAVSGFMYEATNGIALEGDLIYHLSLVLTSNTGNLVYYENLSNYDTFIIHQPLIICSSYMFQHIYW